MPRPPAKNTHVAPPTRSYVQWTPALLQAAEVHATGGDLRLAAELCDFLWADGRVSTALETRARGLLKHHLSFERAGDKRRSGRAVRALEADEDWWTMAPEAELLALLGWGLLLGVGIARLEWEVSAKGRWLPRLTVRHPRDLRYEAVTRQWLLRVDTGHEIEIKPGDREWVLYTPTAGPQPWMYGKWRSVAPFVLGRTYGWSDWQQQSALHGSGVRIIEAPENALDEMCEKATEDAAALRAGGAWCPPPGFKVTVSEAAASTWETFPAQLSTAAVEIAVSITGQNLSSEVRPGVDTGATFQAEVRSDLIAGDGEGLSTCLHDQMLVPWADVNFGDEGIAPWPAWAVVTADALTARSAALKSFADALSALREALRGTSLGIGPETLRALAADHGLTLDDVVDPAPTPAPAPPSPPAPPAPEPTP